MPPKAAKRKVKGAKGDDPWGTPDDQPRKKPRASVPRVDNLDEDQRHEKSLGSKRVHLLSSHHDSILVADHGPCDISQFQSWADWQTKFNEKEKSDKWQFANTFNDNIEAKREEFGDLFDHCHNELNDAGDKYARLLEEPFDTNTKPPSNPSSNLQPPTAKSRQKHPLFKAGRHIFQKCQDLIADHDRADKKTMQDSPRPGPPREQWKGDIASVQELLLYGRQHGENIVECIVIPSSDGKEKGQLLTPDKEELSETGRMAVNMYQKSAEGVMNSGLTWGEMVRSQAGAFGKALDGLNGV